ncbi:hypothetical protein IJI55_02650 [Candidatus Saccharibacteria bacterium]|nr:hypothetical protein [Candidatus Saccharibacteria bacterium]
MDNNSFYNPDPNAPANFSSGSASPSSTPVMAPGIPATPASPTPMGAAPKKPLFGNMSTVQMVILIIVSLLAATFIGLFIWMLVMWLNVKSDVDGQISAAVNTAVSQTETRLAAEYEEQQKYPYSTFTGPSDLGSLSFEFPKTWSVYVAKNGSNGDYEAYLNPDLVSPVSTNTINALRVSILNQSIDNVTRTYDNLLKQGKITVETRAIGGETANVYTGYLTNDIQGIAAVFKIRDKTAIVQTDALVFKDDFTHVLDSIRYNS